MAEVVLRRGINPDFPEELVLAVVVDPDGSPGERAVAALGGRCYEGDGAFYLAQTDGWAASSLADGVLTVDVVVYAAVAGKSLDAFPAGPVDGTVRLLRVTGTTDETVLPEDGVALFKRADDWPILLAPPPAP